MSGKTLLVIVALALVVGTVVGLLLVRAMDEGRSAGLARPARRPPRAGGKKSPVVRGKRPAPKDLREFMKLVSRTRWLGAGRGRGFKQKAGAWQDAVAGRKNEIAPLVADPAAEDATIAWLLWDKGSKRARAVGDRLLAAGVQTDSPTEARSIYRVLTASGYPRVGGLRPVVATLAKTSGAGTDPVKPSRPESCKLWVEISGAK